MSDTVLCLNAGSSSIKFELFEVMPRDELQLAFRGQLEGIGFRPHLTANHGHDEPLVDRTYTVQEVANVAAAIPKLAEWLREHLNGKLPIDIGHRLVFGGTRYSAPVLIDDECLRYLRSVVPLMPLHLPSELLCHTNERGAHDRSSCPGIGSPVSQNGPQRRTTTARRKGANDTSDRAQRYPSATRRI